jgi:hypothetical protein
MSTDEIGLIGINRYGLGFRRSVGGGGNNEPPHDGVPYPLAVLFSAMNNQSLISADAGQGPLGGK